jgi:hypothetical protein
MGRPRRRAEYVFPSEIIEDSVTQGSGREVAGDESKGLGNTVTRNII